MSLGENEVFETGAPPRSGTQHPSIPASQQPGLMNFKYELSIVMSPDIFVLFNKLSSLT
jgi:hypothetical protein